MKRTILATALILGLLPLSASAAVRFGLGIGGAGFGYRPFYGPRIIVPGRAFYGTWWVPPPSYVMTGIPVGYGEVRFDTGAKDAVVNIDGAYAGTVRKLKPLWLQSGTHDIEINQGSGTFDEKVFVPVGKTVTVAPVFSSR